MVVALLVDIITLPTYLFYSSIFYLYKLWRPAKRYTLKGADYLEATYIHDSEYEEESFKTNEILTLEGSTPLGSSIYIEAVIHTSYVTSTVHIAEDGHDYFGEFQAKLSSDKYLLNCGPLTLEIREPFRRWRVSFRGNLKDLSTNDEHFVTIGGWWKPISDARHFYSNSKPSNYLGVVTSPFNICGNVNRMSKFLHSGTIVQYGQMHLELTIREQTVQYRYRGVKERLPTDFLGWSNEMYIYMEDGNKMTYKKSSLFQNWAAMEHGLISRADHVVRRVEMSHSAEALDPEDTAIINMVDTQGFTYHIEKDGITSSFEYTRSDNKNIEIRRIRVCKEGSLTIGYALFRNIREATQVLPEPDFDTAPEYYASTDERIAILPFSNQACQDRSLSGGKGANLARLLAMEQNYMVPSGFVVSTTTYLDFLEANPNIKALVEDLSKPGKHIEHYVKIGEQINSELRLLPPFESEKLTSALTSGRFAVRSSALGEDGSDLSSAGQLESLLNVESEEIGAKILECWASNFRREVITYRRTHGQILNPPMAVVVQKMVTDGVAGVMFTCDPVHNDGNRMIINAVRGLGEQIVSGSTTPDEIIVSRCSGNIEKPDKCCLDDAAIKHLVQVGLYLEKKFGRAQDIEFVYKDGTLHLVQSRDVTGRDRESHFELLTEFDDGSLTDREIYTTANVGEIVPVPYNPLEASILMDLLDKNLTGSFMIDITQCSHILTHTQTTNCLQGLSLQELTGWLPRHFHYGFHLNSQRVFFACGELFLRMYPAIKKDRLIEYTMAGCEIFDEDMFQQAQERYVVPSAVVELRRFYVMLKSLFYISYKRLVEIQECTTSVLSVALPDCDVTYGELFEVMQKQRLLCGKPLRCHTEESMFSSFTYVIVGMLIKGGDGDFSEEAG